MSLTTRSVEGCGGGSRRVRQWRCHSQTRRRWWLWAPRNAATPISCSRTASSWMGADRSRTTMTIRNGRIATVGKTRPVAPDARRIDLGGRTVVPGFFDAHVHYTRAGVNPGYEARRIERAFSIAELQEAIAATREVGAARRSSSPASAAGTTRSSLKRAGRRKRSWMPPRRSTPSTFPAPAVEPARSRTVSAARSSSQRA